MTNKIPTETYNLLKRHLLKYAFFCMVDAFIGLLFAGSTNIYVSIVGSILMIGGLIGFGYYAGKLAGIKEVEDLD